MNLTQKKQTGTLKISREVLATIAEAAAQEISGVYALGGSSMDIYYGIRGQAPRGASVTIVDDLAHVRLRLVLDSDARIQETSVRVQQAVKDAVQNMTGITVSKVNIVITGIHYAVPAEK